MNADAIVRDLVAFSAQSAIVAGAALLLAGALRVPARARYACLRVALAAGLVMPFVLRMPEVPPAPPAGATATIAVNTADSIQSEQAPAFSDAAAGVASSDLESGVAALPWGLAVLTVVALGGVARALLLIVGFVRLRRLARRAVPVELPEYNAAQRQLGTSARVVHVCESIQPATFGFIRPVVLLPAALATAPSDLRTAVVTHELLHVQRRDWFWVVVEEGIRAGLWFHPGIVWLVSQIRLAREEIVDDLSVRSTGDRRAYMKALLAFADNGALLPAPAFARRRQLFHRIVSISKETVMSTPRIATSVMALMTAVVGACLYGSAMFPIITALEASSVSAMPPSVVAAGDRSLSSALPLPTGVTDPIAAAPKGDIPSAARVPVGALTLADPDPQAAIVPTQQQIAGPDNPIPAVRAVPPAWPAQFAGAAFNVAVSARITLDPRGEITDVAATECLVSDAPAKEQRDAICAAFSDATVAAVRRWSYDPPARAPLQFYVITSFRRGTEPAIMHTSRALPLEASPSFAGAALTAIYTNPPISTQESLRQRISELGAIIQELTRIRSAMPPGSDTAALDSGVSRLKNELSGVEDALQRAISRGENPGNASIIRPIQSSPFDDPSSLAAPSGRPVYRAGTRYVQSPRLIRNVPPVYTPEAMAAKLEGFVVLEAIVDEQGRVPVARVIRSIPLLDEAALTAAKQWLFAPTLLNGEPVPVLIQIEMRFDMRTTAGPR